MIYILRLYTIIFLLFLTSCQRDDIDNQTVVEEIIEETETFFDSNFIGKIENEQGKAIEDAKVTIHSNVDYSTDNGVFLFNSVKTNNKGAIIQINKPGYFDHYVFVTKQDNQFSNHNLTLRKKVAPISFSSESDSELIISNNLKLNITSGSFATLDGQIYFGQVQLYTNFYPIEGWMPVIDQNFKRGLLSENQNVQFAFETTNGSTLKIIKSLNLTTNLSNVKFAQLDLNKEKWVESKSYVSGNSHYINVDQSLPYSIGKWANATQVRTQIVNTSQKGVAFTRLEATDDYNNKWILQPDQNGYVSFYAPSTSSINLTTSDWCGNTLNTSTFAISSNTTQNIANIVLDEKNLFLVQSNIEPCGQAITQHDLVNVKLSNSNLQAVAYQTENSQTFVVPSCMKVEKATYYRGKEEKFSISFSGQNNTNSIKISAAPLCIEKISGYFSVNDVPILLNMDQYYIYRESQDQQNLVISDLSGFLISIPSVVSKGKYKPDAIFFNQPSVTDCLLQECIDMTIWIDEISQPGKLVKIRVEGKMGGNIIKGDFVNLLRN